MRRYSTIFIFSILMLGSLLSADAEVYRDVTNGFSIRHPESFRVRGHPNAPMIVADINHRSNTTGLQIRIHRRNGLSFDDYIHWYTGQFQKEMQGISIIDESHETLGSHEGYVITFDARSRNGYFLKSYLIPDKNRFFAFQSGTPYRDRNRMEPLLDTIAASFTLE